MFGSPFAEYQYQPNARGEDGPGAAPRSRSRSGEGGSGREGFSAEQASHLTLDAVKGSNTGDRSVALKLEGLLTDNSASSLQNHQAAALTAALEDWMRITHHVMDYQYVHDMNSYVKSVQEDERTRLDRQFNSITNDVMVKKNMYMMTQREADKMRSRTRVVLHTMLFVSCFAFLYANRGFFGTFGWVVMAAASFAFGVYVIMFVKTNGSRRYDDWDKMYFNDGKDIEAEGAGEDLAAPQQCEQSGGVPFATTSA